MNKKILALTLLFSSVALNADATPVEETSVESAVVAPVTEVVKKPEYLNNAWDAVKNNRLMTAVLVSSAFLFGAIAHAAVSNNDVVEEDAE